MSDYRYWSVDGIVNEGFAASATIDFDGRSIVSGGDGYLDFDLLRSGEDSLLLMHRSGAGDEWREFRSYTVDHMGSPSDRRGKISIDSLVRGEYTLAKGQSVIGREEIRADEGEGILIFPNPAGRYIRINAGSTLENERLTAEVYNVNGKVVKRQLFSKTTEIDINNLGSGTYIIVISNQAGRLKSERVVVD